jgi:hypothetical protein
LQIGDPTVTDKFDKDDLELLETLLGEKLHGKRDYRKIKKAEALRLNQIFCANMRKVISASLDALKYPTI